METWKNIAEYEDLYQISDSGNVFNIKKGTYLKPSPDQKGYLRVNLWKDGGYKTKKVHRLVSKAFLDNKENKPQVNHKDCDKSNNHVSNLEWATRAENIQHAYDNSLIIKYGENNGRSKVTESDVYEIKALLSNGTKQTKIAELFNVSTSIVSNINTGRTWTHLNKGLTWQEI